MPIANQIIHLPLDSIVVNRKLRQRSRIDESALDLAFSIGSSQWINPLLVDKESSALIAGERRFTAVGLLQTAWNQRDNLPNELSRLAPVLKCTQSSWEHWTKVPCQLASNLTEIELQVFELRENKDRLDLAWQDKAKAIYNIHALAITQSTKKWTSTDTAQLINLDQSETARYLRVWRHMISGDDKVQRIIEESGSSRSALEAIDRVQSRRRDAPIMIGKAEPISPAPVFFGTAEEISSIVEEVIEEPQSEPPSPILTADFHQWAAEYSGSPFNFIHCDFPYGISYNQSASQGTAVDTKLLGEYNDSESVYWELLTTLTQHSEKLISPAAHIMFWFSQNLRRETENFFRNNLPGCTIQPFLMIWHCSDNSGILPDPSRYGRRTYETAMLITLGDRKIAQPKALSFSSPRGQTRIHRSEKPVVVLNHFLSMFIDDTSNVLDPTCGSGTSLISATKLNARSVLGLEKDPSMAEQAQRFYQQQT